MYYVIVRIYVHHVAILLCVCVRVCVCVCRLHKMLLCNSLISLVRVVIVVHIFSRCLLMLSIG